MQASTFPALAEQRIHSGPRFCLDMHGTYEVGKMASRLKCTGERVSGYSEGLIESKYHRDGAARKGQHSGPQLLHFSEIFGDRIQISRRPASPVLSQPSGCPIKAEFGEGSRQVAAVFHNCVESLRCFESLRKTACRLKNGNIDLHSEHSKHSEDSEHEDAPARKEWLPSMMTAMTMSLIVLTAPGPTATNHSFKFSDFAMADQLGQLRQGALVLEKAVEGLSKVRFDDLGLVVLDKAVTLVTGSTSVDPEALDKEVDGLLSGEKDISEDVRNGIKSLLENSWSTIVDVVTHFNPISIGESAGASISTFLESSAERIAAFELSTLVSLGERWLILTPLIAIPMAWEMKRRQSDKDSRAKKDQATERGEHSQLRGEQVRRELERIELRSMVLDAVTSLGKTALQPPRSRQESGVVRRQINDMLERLEDLNPVGDPMLLVPEVASSVSSQAVPSDALAYIPTSPTIDGDWNLIYVSETSEVGNFQESTLLNGIGLDRPRQKVWQAASVSSLTNDSDASPNSPLLTRNTAEFRLGPLGVFQVTLQGNWENLKDGQTALVSYDTFSAQATELLGNKLSEDLPALRLSLPSELQRSTEWSVVYVDDHLRINRGGRGQFFLFEKNE